MKRTIEVYLPKWVTVLYGVMAILLIPWIFDLATSLPSRHITRHWDTLWVGFDVIMLLTLVVTIFFIVKRAIWVIVSATALATLWVIDAWFDVLTSRPGAELRKAIFFALVEVSLALLTYRIIYHAVKKTTQEKDLKLTGK
jgi:hypothetical protein